VNCRARVLNSVPCSYSVSAIGKFALLRYLSEFRFQVLVLTAITSEGYYGVCYIDR